MEKIFLLGLILFSSLTFAEQESLSPEESGISCDTTRGYDADSEEQAFEKFTISSENGSEERFIHLANSKEIFTCNKTEDEDTLWCTGDTYQINEDQHLEDTKEDQKFKFDIYVSLTPKENGYMDGTAIAPIGFLGADKETPLECYYTKWSFM